MEIYTILPTRSQKTFDLYTGVRYNVTKPWLERPQ